MFAKRNSKTETKHKPQQESLESYFLRTPRDGKKYIAQFKEELRRQEVMLLFQAEKSAIERGNIDDVVKLSELINKRLENVKDFGFINQYDKANKPIDSL